jgi:hypothetical protein
VSKNLKSAAVLALFLVAGLGVENLLSLPAYSQPAEGFEMGKGPGQYDAISANEHWTKGQQYEKQGQTQYAIVEYGKVADIAVKAGKKNELAKSMADSLIATFQNLESGSFMKGQMQIAAQASENKLKLIEMLHGKESEKYKQAASSKDVYSGQGSGNSGNR